MVIPDLRKGARALAVELARVPLVVTGGSGFVGLALLAILGEAGVAVDVLDLATPERVLPHFEPLRLHRYHCVDLTSGEQLDRAGASLPERLALIHLASSISTNRALDASGVRELEIQLSTAHRLLEAFHGRLAAIVFGSSISVFGPLKNVRCDEFTPARPDEIYGLGKLAAEEVFNAYGRKLRIPVASLRISHVFGPFEHLESATHPGRARRAVPNFLRAALRSEAIMIKGDGADLRDFVHGYDVAQAILRALLCAASGAYVIANGESVTIRRLAETVASLVTPPVAVHIGVSSAARRDYAFSVSRAIADIGYAPTVSLRNGLREELEWMRTVGDG